MQHECFSPALQFVGAPIQGRYYRDENRSSDEHVGQGRDVSHDDVTDNEDDVLSLDDDVLSVDDDILSVDDEESTPD